MHFSVCNGQLHTCYIHRYNIMTLNWWEAKYTTDTQECNSFSTFCAICVGGKHISEILRDSDFGFWISDTERLMCWGALNRGWKLPLEQSFLRSLCSGAGILPPARVPSLVSGTIALAQAHQFTSQGTGGSPLQVCITPHGEFHPSRRSFPAPTETSGSCRHVGIEKCFQQVWKRHAFEWLAPHQRSSCTWLKSLILF